MSFSSFVNGIADTVKAGVKTVTDSRVIPNMVGKVTRAGIDVGKVGANIGLKGTATTLKRTSEVVDFTRRNKDTIINGAKSIGKGVMLEANDFAQAGAGIIETIDKSPFIKKVGLDRSLIKRQFTKPGVGLVAAGALAVGTVQAGDDYIKSRQGRNDGQLYKPTPMMNTPYQLSQQMAYGNSIGNSFADNAGATGDLVFALKNMR